MSDVQPGEDPFYQDAMLQYLLGGGDPMMPYLDPAQVSMLYGAVPPSLTPGQQGNYLQDYLSIMMDPAVAAIFGSGAYGSDAFAPTATYEQVATPGQDQLMRYMQRPGTIEAYIAEQILSGGTASSALGELRQAYEANPEDPEVSGLVSQLPLQETAEGWDTDWARASENFMALEQTFMQDPTPGTRGAILDPMTGEVIAPAEELVQMVDEFGNPTLMRVEMDESPMAEWFRERGLSLPTDVYTPEDLLGQDWAQGQVRVDEMRQAWEQAQQEFLAADQAAAMPNNEAENFAVDVLGASAGMMPGATPTGGFGTEINPDIRDIGTSVTGPVEQAMNYTLPGTINEPVPDFASVGMTAPTELTMPQTAEEFMAYADGAWSRLSPEQREAMINFAIDQTVFEQTENGPWQQAVDEMTGQTGGEPGWTTLPPFDSLGVGGPMFDDFGGGEFADSDPLRDTTSNVQDRRSEHEDETAFNPPEGAYFHNGAWFDARDHLIGYAPSEDAALVTPDRYQDQMALDAYREWLRNDPRWGVDASPDTGPQSEERFDETAQARGPFRFQLSEAQSAGRRIDQRNTERRYTERDRRRSGALRSFQNLTQQVGQTYGADYGRAAAQAWLMQQQGVTPLQQQLAARRQVPIGMGLVGSGYLPGM